MSGPSRTLRLLVPLLAVAVLAAACGSASSTPAPTAPPATPRPSASAKASVAPSAAASASARASASDSLGLPHVNAALEDKLPTFIGNVGLAKFSQPLSSWVASTKGGERVLYAPWLVKFGKTPSDVDIAIAADLSFAENVRVSAIQVPGVSAAALQSGFGDSAKSAGWTVKPVTVAQKAVLEITDPTAATTGTLAVGYVYAKDDILYTVVTDDLNLLVEALIKLP
jgi:hypothetical protein